MIASYEVVIGGFSVLSLVTGRSREAQPELLAAIECVQKFVHALALLAGLKGLVGIMYRDPRRLRILLLYQVCDLVMQTVAIFFREIEACHELSQLKQLHKDKYSKLTCGTVRREILIEYCIRSALFSYFTYVIWSLITRLEAGEFGRQDFFDHELADHAALGDSLPPWFFMGHPGGDDNAGFLSQQRAPLNGPASGMPQPFSGAPRTLDPPQAQSIEPFRGTPHRLE
jgi:hypothetical protein